MSAEIREDVSGASGICEVVMALCFGMELRPMSWALKVDLRTQEMFKISCYILYANELH